MTSVSPGSVKWQLKGRQAMAAEVVRTPTVTSGRSTLEIDHTEDGRTIITVSQQFCTDNFVPNGDIYRLMGGTDKTMLMRLSKVAIKNMPQLPAASAPEWNGDAPHANT